MIFFFGGGDVCFDFLYNFVWNIYNPKNSARYNKCMYVFM